FKGGFRACSPAKAPATAAFAERRTFFPSTSATSPRSTKCAWPLCWPSPLSRFASLIRPLATPSTVPTWTPSAPITSMFRAMLSVIIWSLLWVHRLRWSLNSEWLSQRAWHRARQTICNNPGSRISKWRPAVQTSPPCRVVNDFAAAAGALGKWFTTHAVRLRPPHAHASRSPSGGVPPRQLPLRTDEVASVAVRIVFQVILVLWLGLPE